MCVYMCVYICMCMKVLFFGSAVNVAQSSDILKAEGFLMLVPKLFEL